MGPRVSPRALTLTQPYTPTLGVLGGTNGRRTLVGLKRSFANFVRKTSVSVTEGQSMEWAQVSTHTTAVFVSFRVQPTDAHLTPLVPDDRGQPA